MSEAEKIAVLETQVAAHDRIICEVVDAVREIKDRLLGRPSWQITTVISALTGACGAMLMFIINILIK